MCVYSINGIEINNCHKSELCRFPVNISIKWYCDYRVLGYASILLRFNGHRFCILYRRNYLKTGFLRFWIYHHPSIMFLSRLPEP